MKIFVNIKNSVSNWVLNNANEKLKYTVITFCYISCFSHSLDGRSYSVMTVYLTIFFFFSYVVVLRYIGKILIPSLRRIFSLHYRFYYNVIVFGVWKDFLLLLKKYFTITLSFQIAVFHRFLEEMFLFCNTFFFWLGICRTSWKDFINLPIFCYFACFSEFWQSTYYIPKCHIFTFRIVSSKSNIYHVTFSFYSICLRYLGRTMLLHLNNIFLCYNLIN